MGAWGTGAFENDDALDIVGTLERLSDEEAPAAAQRLFESVIAEVEFVASPTASEAVAIAGLMALARDPGLASQVQPPPLGLPAVAALLAASDAALAVRALDRLLQPDDNEWYALWQEADLLDDATAQVRSLKAVLTRPDSPGAP